MYAMTTHEVVKVQKFTKRETRKPMVSAILTLIIYNALLSHKLTLLVTITDLLRLRLKFM